jgi:hypothetical protein
MLLSFNRACCAESNEARAVSDDVLAARRVTIEAGAFGSSRHSRYISLTSLRDVLISRPGFVVVNSPRFRADMSVDTPILKKAAASLSGMGSLSVILL